METQGIERRILGLVGQALGRFSMLRPGDRVAVGISGGKDSLALLHALGAYRGRTPAPYDLIAVTVEQGKFTSPIAPLRDHIEALGVQWILREDAATLRLVRDAVAHGCDVCSRHRRRSLYEIAGELGCNVLALGHTADDCAEALLRNILFNGRIASLPPVADSRQGDVRLIRPLVYVTEDLTAAYVRARGVPTVGCICADKAGPRAEIRTFLGALSARHPGVAASLSAALGNVNPYTLFDPALSKAGADPAPAFAESIEGQATSWEGR
jgi:tRNA 2-thiocytidine biosynthesis protein TtcA